MASINLEKFTFSGAGSLNVHLDDEMRKTHNHYNKDIDKSKSYLNYNIGCDDYNEVLIKLNKRVNEVDEQIKPYRKSNDRIVLVGAITDCPSSLEDQNKEFFNFAHEFFVNKFGQENVFGSFAHLDEKHEYLKDNELKESLYHMHTYIAPYTEEKGINGKAFMTRSMLTDLQAEFNQAVKKEFGIEYNVGKKADYKTIAELKESSLKKELELRQENKKFEEKINSLQNELERTYNSLVNYEKEFDEKLEEEKAKLEEQNKILLEREKKLAEENATLAFRQAMIELEKEKRSLKRRVQFYEDKNPELKEMYENHKLQNHQHQKEKREDKEKKVIFKM